MQVQQWSLIPFNSCLFPKRVANVLKNCGVSDGDAIIIISLLFSKYMAAHCLSYQLSLINK